MSKVCEMKTGEKNDYKRFSFNFPKEIHLKYIFLELLRKILLLLLFLATRNKKLRERKRIVMDECLNKII